MSTPTHNASEVRAEDLPNLDECTLAALQFFAGKKLPAVPTDMFARPLVIGSGNAASAGEVLFADTNAAFATESNFENRLAHVEADGVVIVSASGGKHAPDIAKTAKEKGEKVLLLTNTDSSPVAEVLNDDDTIVVFPKRPEPYSYNISTYLGMFLAHTGEDAGTLAEHIDTAVKPVCDKAILGRDAFVVTVPAQHGAIADMLQTKFDELFGSMVRGRVYTDEEVKHAKTVVYSQREARIAFGDSGGHERELVVPLPDNCGPATLMVVGYYVVGRIQATHPPYFKDNIEAYAKEASETFGHTISPIVE